MLIRSCSPLTCHITGSFKSALQVQRVVLLSLCQLLLLFMQYITRFAHWHFIQSVLVLIFYDTSTSPLNKVGLAVVMGASTACKFPAKCEVQLLSSTEACDRLFLFVMQLP